MALAKMCHVNLNYSWTNSLEPQWPTTGWMLLLYRRPIHQPTLLAVDRITYYPANTKYAALNHRTAVELEELSTVLVLLIMAETCYRQCTTPANGYSALPAGTLAMT